MGSSFLCVLLIMVYLLFVAIIMPHKFKRVLRKGYGYPKSKQKPIQQQPHHSTLQDAEGLSSAKSTNQDSTTDISPDMDTQTVTTSTSSNAETQTKISVSPNHLQVDVGIQCVMDDKICEEQGTQTEVPIYKF